MGINQNLEELKWELLEEEGITKEDLELVDLDIEFTPVIPVKNGKPYDVIKTVGDSYLISDHPIVNTAISSEALKVMRYRYLTKRENPFANMFKK